MTGKFRLRKDTLGIVTATHIAALVPEGSIVEIALSPPEGAHLVDILWQGTPMMMFLRDISNGGEAFIENPGRTPGTDNKS
jgi:hypothetical protein